ncbi:ImmA/IrrE family metallo-endopeptidase [Macrococcus capreoli]|uniref:ImmA/IrrE family metallo-endopeptidase n=1 Tax=Macrococcus capreoli TaxID=2982690 RepID=UPI003EE5DBC5
MMMYENEVIIKEVDFLPPGHSGYYQDGVILIDKNLKPEHKLEVLAEEIAHHELSYGDLRNIKDIYIYKYELKARRYGMEILITLDDIIEAFRQGLRNMYELASFFEVSKSYVKEALQHYSQKYSNRVYHKGFIFSFEPLQLEELILLDQI